jgi:hypothetical protein
MTIPRITPVQAIMDKIKAFKRDQKEDTIRSYEGRLKLLGADPQNYPAQLTAASTRKDKQFRKDKGAMLWDLVRRLWLSFLTYSYCFRNFISARCPLLSRIRFLRLSAWAFGSSLMLWKSNSRCSLP